MSKLEPGLTKSLDLALIRQNNVLKEENLELKLYIERQKNRIKYLNLGPGARKNFSVIKSHTTWIPFNVLSRIRFRSYIHN